VSELEKVPKICSCTIQILESAECDQTKTNSSKTIHCTCSGECQRRATSEDRAWKAVRASMRWCQCNTDLTNSAASDASSDLPYHGMPWIDTSRCMDFLQIRIETSAKWRILYLSWNKYKDRTHTISSHSNRFVLSVESSTHCFGLPRAILIQERSNIVTC